ncbi:MFS transporter [Bartonella sp. DGB1]|uniref:MFS transporter n=1 Tax=Bartonella sp. DGB1 TaxID=3239807 RepID=UPI0035243BC7
MYKKIYLFRILYFLPMALSKMLFPILWEMEGKLDLFSISYVTMACVGAFSFLYAKVIKKFGLAYSLAFGYILYAVGLILRAFPVDIYLAMTTGIVAGIGASAVGLVLSALMVNIDSEVRPKVILKIGNISAIVNMLGRTIAGFLVAGLAYFTIYNYQLAIILTGVITFSGCLFINKKEDIYKYNPKQKNKDKQNLSFIKNFKANKSLYLSLMSYVFISGIFFACFLPLIPIYLKNLDFSISAIGMIMSLAVVSALAAKNLYMYVSANDSIFAYMVFACLKAITISLLFYILGQQLAILYVACLLIYNMFSSIEGIIESILELKIAEENDSATIFGLIQSCYLSGDVLGGILMPIVYKYNIFVNYPILVGVIMLSCSLIFATCARVSKKSSESVSVTA